jgi:hypothetical protein
MIVIQILQVHRWYLTKIRYEQCNPEYNSFIRITAARVQKRSATTTAFLKRLVQKSLFMQKQHLIEKRQQTQGSAEIAEKR